MITLDEAIEILSRPKTMKGTPQDILEAHDMAITALELFGNSEQLPSAQLERKGEWIPVDSFSAFGGDEEIWIAHGNPIAFHYCSECKNHAHADEFGKELLTSFCPECGADMRGNEDDTD